MSSEEGRIIWLGTASVSMEISVKKRLSDFYSRFAVRVFLLSFIAESYRDPIL